MTDATAKGPPRPAADVVAGLELSDDARRLLRPALPAETYFDELVKAGLSADAVRVMSRLLPVKRAIWWGCLCVWSAHRHKPTAGTEDVCRSAVAWLRTGADDARRAANDAGLRARPSTPAGMLGAAVFTAEGSLSVPNQPEVKADPAVAPTLVASAVLAASRAGGAALTEQTRREYLAVAVEVYRGTNSWEPGG